MKISLVIPVALAALLSTGWAADQNLKIVCYYGSWATYRPDNGQFTSESIPPNLCTHIVYAYTGLAGDGGIMVLDNWLSLDDGLGDFRKFTGIKRYNQNIKLMAGIGGWNEGPKKFSRMASNPGSRATFVRSVVQFLEMYGFDGLSIDWMYPAGDGASNADKANYVHLLKEIRNAFAPKKWVLAIAGSGNEDIVTKGFDVKGISQYVDFVSLLSFDYHGSWESVTGHNSPVAPRREDSAQNRKANQQYSVNVWIKKGMDPRKLVLGIPTYGRSFSLQSQDRKRVGSPSIGPGAQGPYTGQAGTLGYNELMENFKNQEGTWIEEWDEQQLVPFATRGNFWISYDNPSSMRVKAGFIIQQGLGGAMIFSLETDDFLGTSGQTFPLTNAIKETFSGDFTDTWTFPTVVFEETDSGSWRPPTVNPNPSSQSGGTWAPPPTSKPGLCTGPGNIKNPDDCGSFYACAMNVDGKYNGILTHCPSKLGFDERTGVCDYKENIPGCH